MAGIHFNYFTAAETEQYTFYRIPKALFTERRFQALSCEAKVLYGMMLDRMGLSIRNQWFDSQGRAYIIFTVEDVMGVMGCQSQKAVRLMKELDTVDGIGLIEKKRIGLGRPNRIYVKNFMTGGMAESMPETAVDGGMAEPVPETDAVQEQNWWICGESLLENENGQKENPGICNEKDGANQENWWDMETGGISESGSLGQRGDLRGNAAAGGITGNGFADKTVEAMMREMLLGEKTDTGCIREQELQGVCAPVFPEPQPQDSEKQEPVIVKNSIPQQRDSKRNDTEYSETAFSSCYVSHPSYPSYPSGSSAPCGSQGCMPADSGMDGIEKEMDSYRTCIRGNIDYQCFRPQETEDVDELVELMVDTMMLPDRGTVRVAGTEKPASAVKSRFMKLVHSHIEYVMLCMQKHTGKIRNIKAYLLTALYNSPLTISSYYRAEANHDLYGCGI